MLALPDAARADWLFGGYMGAAGTSSNTLTVSARIGRAVFDLPTLRTRARHSDRRGTTASGPVCRCRAATKDHSASRSSGTHAKAIAQIDPRASDLNAFQQSHGLNFLLGNVAYRFSPAARPLHRGRSRRRGISTPHVESTFRNAHQEQYQYGGPAWQAGAGLEYHLWQFVYGIADARITRVTEKHLRGAGAEIAGRFFTRHVDFGVALRLPNR